MGILTLIHVLVMWHVNIIRAYAKARAGMHYVFNSAIYLTETGAVLLMHESVMLHVGIPTAIFAWETMLIRIAEE